MSLLFNRTARIIRPICYSPVVRFQSTIAASSKVTPNISLTNSLPKQDIYKSISALKLSSNGSKDLYAITRLYNMPYLVTKGDKIYLPYKLKNVKVGDVLNLNDVTTLGSTTHTLNVSSGIDTSIYELQASVVEITREPLYQVVKKKPRCRRVKTTNVEPFQTVLRVNELRLK
ncbi:Mrpl49 protein [Candida orthopsilosis Co 90-125]|uniref:Large ribosomal subunit protein bL21m n=1 Tax=Candida orthopsilosis (strain 90-125) TaxID=1136231 RepID=H8XAE1_CANO9|nr:Mrpl49 protein [Candida orthopsilosis Co 90-125]CCG25118.1 Mrpl49 protein [Candida orthopsilosis Co 90-125]